MIQTERLILRPFEPGDREAYIEFLADPRVGAWLGGPFSREAAARRFDDRLPDQADAACPQRMALVRRADGRLIGHCGLAAVPEHSAMPAGLEIGWALIPDSWGKGYASEAARAAIADGFARWDIPEILAFTGETNHRSQAVMRRLGMARDPGRDFDHPLLGDDHPLKRHLVFAIGRP